MKKIFALLLLLLGTWQIQAQMQAMFGYSTFYALEQDMPYVETYLQFDAWTLQFEPTNDEVYKAMVEVVLVARMGDSVCYAKKYDLSSPTVSDTTELDFSFLDVQRFALRNGIYDLEVRVRDKATGMEPAVLTEKLVVMYDSEHPRLSSLQLIAEARPTVSENMLSRNGYDMEPYVSDFVPAQVEQLNFYYEVYNISAEIGRQPFVAMAYVEVQETGVPVDGLRIAARKQAEKVVPVYGTIDIADLPSGNYNLVVELRNREGDLLLYKRKAFFRSNPGVERKPASDFSTTFVGQYTDADQLRLYIDALSPIASDLEREVISDYAKHGGTVEEMQAFLYQFWFERGALTAASDWDKYRARIDYVQENFSYPRTPGIHTDRGRVFLKYGQPDFVRDEKNFVGAQMKTYGLLDKHNDADMGQQSVESNDGKQTGHVYYLPYQLWRYNYLPNEEPNRVFIFWDEHRSGYYRLLNSNARGEIQEAGWERRLSRNQLPEDEVGEVGEQFNRGY